MPSVDRLGDAVSRRPALGYAIAVAFALLAVAVRVAFDGLLGPAQLPYLTLFPAIFVVAWLIGGGPAMLTTAAGGAAVAWAILAPRGSFAVDAGTDRAGLALYLLVGLFCAWTGSLQRRARIAIDASERERSQSEQKTQQLLSNVPGGAGFIVDRDLRYTMAAGDILSAAGRSPNDLIGKTIAEALGAERAPPYEARYRQALAGESFVWEHEARGRTIVSRGVPLRDETGDVYAALAFALDITEQRRAETALRDSEARLRALADAMPQLVWVADAGGAVQYYNERIRQYAGHGRRDDGSWPWRPLVDEADLDATVRAWQAAARAGTPYYAEHRLRMADGSSRWHLSRAVPGRNEAGEVVSWYGTATDIDDLKRAESALRESERRAQLAIRIGQLGVWHYDAATEQVDLDPRMAELCGEPGAASPLPFARMLMHIHADDSDRVLAAIAAALDPAGSGACDFDCRIALRDGGVRWLHVSGETEFAGEGEGRRAVGIVGTARDITRRRNGEAASGSP